MILVQMFHSEYVQYNLAVEVSRELMEKANIAHALAANAFNTRVVNTAE